jgi:hypothetical protein
MHRELFAIESFEQLYEVLQQVTDRIAAGEAV